MCKMINMRAVVLASLLIAGCGGAAIEESVLEHGALSKMSHADILVKLQSGELADTSIIFRNGGFIAFKDDEAMGDLIAQSAASKVVAAPAGRRRGNEMGLPTFRRPGGAVVPPWRIWLMFGIAGIGFLMALAGSLWMLILAFQTSVGWGIAFLLFPPIFIFMNLGKVWQPLVMNITGLIFMLFCFFVLL